MMNMFLSSLELVLNTMNIRLLQREEIPLIWQIDRREIVENIYYLCDGELLLKPDYFDIQGWPPGEPEQYTPILLDCYDRCGTFWGAFENDLLVGASFRRANSLAQRRTHYNSNSCMS